MADVIYGPGGAQGQLCAFCGEWLPKKGFDEHWMTDCPVMKKLAENPIELEYGSGAMMIIPDQPETLKSVVLRLMGEALKGGLIFNTIESAKVWQDLILAVQRER